MEEVEKQNRVVEASWEDVQLEDPLAMEVGYRLIPMVDSRQNGELLGRISGIRKKFAQETGYLPPVVHIRDNMELKPSFFYRILMKGVEIGHGEAHPGRWLAINPGNAVGSLEGDITQEPAFGLPAVWIDDSLREQAQVQGYTVVAASTVIATHFNHALTKYASELFGRQEAQMLFDRVSKELPKMTENMIPDMLSLTVLHKVLQNLLSEQVPIRDMRTILEALAEHAPEQKDPAELTAVVRVALRRAITQHWFGDQDEIQVIGLDASLERILVQAMQSGGGLEPGLAENIEQQAADAVRHQEMSGGAPVLLVNHSLRSLLSRFLRRSLPQLAVLSNMEISEGRRIRMTSMIGGQPH
ncbi:FHIPEP family protein [Proteus penneri ATCC 35198]|nr:FHIPEP family protein [Proteus penneri ATCC 35198]